MENTISVLLFQSHVVDKKHSLEFDKDRVAYRHKTFDAILSKGFRAYIEKEMAKGDLRYPLMLELRADDYFTKSKKYTKSDGVEGTKNVITLLGCANITQGRFESKSLDDVVNDLEEIYASEVSEDSEE